MQDEELEEKEESESGSDGGTDINPEALDAVFGEDFDDDVEGEDYVKKQNQEEDDDGVVPAWTDDDSRDWY